MKKILFVSNLFPPHHIGGYEIACFDTFNLLIENNYECMVLTSDYSNNNLNSINKNEKFINRSLKLHTDFKNEENCLSYLEAENHNCNIFKNLCDKYQPDFIYFWNVWGIGSKIIKMTNPNKSIFHIMDFSLLIYNFSVIKYLKFFLLNNIPRPINLRRRVKNIIFISDFVSKRFKGYKFQNKSIIYPFLKDFDKIKFKKEFNNKTKSFKGVFLGQIEKHKGIIELCSYIKEINTDFGYNKIKLDIYGKSLSGLDKEIILNFNSFVNIINDKSRDYILDSLHLYDVGFFPSIWEEPFGIAQIEMLAAGLPVLSTGRGGSKEALLNNNSISYHDKTTFKSLLINLLNNYNEIGSNYGKQARKTVNKKFISTVYVNKINNFFNELVK